MAGVLEVPDGGECFGDEATIPITLGTVAGRYKLEQELGRGGMSHVYCAVDLATQQSVAIKTMRNLRSLTGRQRFVREARVTLQLGHPNIVRLLDFGSDEHFGYFQVLELLEGESLQEEMSRHRAFAVAETLAILGPILRALLAAHAKGLVHRDLKPDNIVLAREGGRIVPKLIDFGMALDVNEEVPITQVGVRLGTPLYMSPEQLRGDTVGPEADLWAFGVLAFQMTFGRWPFPARKSSELYRLQRRGVRWGVRGDHPLKALLETCLAFEPAHRRITAQHLSIFNVVGGAHNFRQEG